MQMQFVDASPIKCSDSVNHEYFKSMSLYESKDNFFVENNIKVDVNKEDETFK